MPLPDFFGAVAGQTVEYQSALLEIDRSARLSYLPMPFSKRARFIVTNDGERDYSRVWGDHTGKPMPGVKHNGERT